MPLPAMSGAEPCAACATACWSPKLSDAASPRLPASSEATLDTMSPYMFVVTMTSNASGVRMSCAHAASMW